ncbi:MAG: hypothetical protein WA190_17995, partial [Usitatibacter sp.]
GRDDIGRLEPGLAADVVGFRIDDIAHAGALGGPVAALVTCAPTRVAFSVINGRVVAEGGELVGVDIAALVERHNAASRRLLARSGLL